MEYSKEYNKRLMAREVSTKKNHLISVFENFENTFSDKKKKYFDKLQSLPAAWEQICNFVLESSSESPQPQFELLFSYTLKFVLRADWRHASKATKTHLTLTLQRLINELTNTKNHLSILPQCRVLESVINEPWDHPVLKKIFQDEETTIDELIDYFHMENGKVVVARLEMLLESKCEDLAFRLSKSCLMTYNSTHPLELDLNQNEYNYIMDMYLCCSFKIKNTSDLIAEMKNFDLCEGLQLLRRYRLNGGVAGGYNESCKEARIWKYSKKTIELISNTLLANAVLHDDLDDADVEFLQELILEWAAIHTTSLNEIFSPVPSEIMRKCVLIARCSKCIYTFCSFLIECGGKENDINQVTRCLIRAINQNMNEIEQYRVNSDREKLKSAYELLCKGFIQISNLFREYKNIYKECLLTAFSITPSREYLEKLEQFIDKESSDESNVEPIIKIENNNKISVSDQNDTAETGEQKTLTETENESNEISENRDIQKTNEVPVKKEALEELNSDSIRGNGPAYLNEVESLKVEESLKTDLNSILRYQRYHALSWDLEWSELKANCEIYLEIFEKRGFDEVELKYLDLDYEQFKNRPNQYEDFGGIEKGYEQYVLYSDYTDEEFGMFDKSSLSSAETDFDDVDYRPKRKKPKAKKKRPLPKAKVEYSEDDMEFQDYENVQPNTKDSRNKKKRRKRADEHELDINRGRPRKTQQTNEETSDANVDSQSENQPPVNSDTALDEDSLLENISNVKSNPNNLQMLRQFRINLSKASKCEENASENGGDKKDIFVDGNRLQELQICIPKCDLITVNGTLLLKKPKHESEVDDTIEKTEECDYEKKAIKLEEDTITTTLPIRRPKPQSSATLYLPRKDVPDVKVVKKDEAYLPRKDMPDVKVVRKDEAYLPRKDMPDVKVVRKDEAYQPIKDMPHVKVVRKDEAAYAFLRHRRAAMAKLSKMKKLGLIERSVPRVGHYTPDSLAGLDDQMSDLFGDLLSDGNETRLPEETEEVPVVENVPASTSTLVTNSSNVSSVTGTSDERHTYLTTTLDSEESKPQELPSNLKPSTIEHMGNLTVSLQPLKYSDYPVLLNSSSTKPASTALPSFPQISPSRSVTSRISSNKELPVHSSTTSRANNVASYLTESIDSWNTGLHSNSKMKSMPSLSSSSVSATANNILPNESLYPVVRIPKYHPEMTTSGVKCVIPHSSSSAPTQRSSAATKVTYSQKLISSGTSAAMDPNDEISQSKLRRALQRTAVNGSHSKLYSSTSTVKSTTKNDNLNTVQKILGEYRKTISEFPELEHVKAQRRRSSNANPTKRQRKPRRENVSNVNTMMLAMKEPLVKIRRCAEPLYTKASTENQMSNIQVPQTSILSGHLQGNQPNSVQHLPSYSTACTSSQNYSISDYKSVNSSYSASGPTIAVNGYPENIIARTNSYSVNMTTLQLGVGGNAVTSNVHLINGTNVVPISSYSLGDQSYAASSLPNQMQIPVSDANIMNSNGCVEDNGYKLYSFPQNTNYETCTSVIATTPLNTYKNVLPATSGSDNTNSVMLLENTNTDDTNDELKVPLFNATVSNEAGNADDPENVPIISIPEDPYQVSYGSWFTFFEGNQTVSQNDNTYLKTDDDAGSSNQNLQLISTTDVLKQNAQSFDNNVLNNVDDLLYSYPQ